MTGLNLESIGKKIRKRKTSYLSQMINVSKLNCI